jgi:purine-binding chemotaxis protein CheW
VRGVINLRGVIVPIFDLRARFGMGRTEPGKTHVVIIVSIGSRVIGLLVDAVSDILTTTTDQIRPIPELDDRQERDFLDGLIAIDSRMVTLIALAELFHADTSAGAAAATPLN